MIKIVLEEPCTLNIHTLYMLSFDIETTGLSPADSITCACIYDPIQHIQKTYIFPLGDSIDDFLYHLNTADSLCAFNGARFDIPFIQRQWHLQEDQVQKWRLKLCDVYESCQQVFRKGFSLNQLLQYNGIPVKTGSGKEAIVLAEQEKWMELGEYCMQVLLTVSHAFECVISNTIKKQDTIKTYQVSTLPLIKLPFNLKNQPRLAIRTHPISGKQDFIQLS